METQMYTLLRQSLSQAAKAGKITEEDIVAYGMFFDTVKDDPEALRMAILNLHAATGLFEEVVHHYRSVESQSQDADRIAAIRAQI